MNKKILTLGLLSILLILMIALIAIGVIMIAESGSGKRIRAA